MHIMHILAWCSDKKPFIWKNKYKCSSFIPQLFLSILMHCDVSANTRLLCVHFVKNSVENFLIVIKIGIKHT